MYHVISATEASRYVQANLNHAPINTNEFWERLPDCENNGFWCSSYLNSDLIREKEIFMQLVELLGGLDDNRLMFNKSLDSVVKSNVLISTNRSVTLCNVHLLKKNSSKFKYSDPKTLRQILFVIFPQLKKRTPSLSTSTPKWAIELIQRLKR